MMKFEKGDRVRNSSTKEEGIILNIGRKLIRVRLNQYMDQEGNFIIYDNKKDVSFEPKFLDIIETKENYDKTKR